MTVNMNKKNGIDIVSAGAVINIGNLPSGSTTTIGTNSLNGILVEAAKTTPNTEPNSVTIDPLTVSANGSSGIYIAGTAGNASATIKNSTISGNGDTGVLVEEHG